MTPAVKALQTTLAAEHAAVFVLGALGGRTSASGDPRRYAALTSAYRAHQERRDAVIALIREAGREPVGAEPGYRLPADLSTGIAVDAEALRVERSCAATYAFLVASTDGHRRRFGIDALLDAAVRELDFGGRPRRLPGL